MFETSFENLYLFELEGPHLVTTEHRNPGIGSAIAASCQFCHHFVLRNLLSFSFQVICAIGSLNAAYGVLARGLNTFHG